MADQTIDQVAPGGVVNLKDAPAGLDDATFDSLFPAEPTSTTVAPTQDAAPAPAVVNPPTQSTTTPNAPFIKGNKSVYNTPEAAVEGINQKDALIENLRQRYALTTGVDPITNQPIQAQSQQPQPLDYSNNRKQYLDDLYAAAKSGSPDAYGDVQAKFFLDTLKPLQPYITRAAREQAVEVVSQDLKGVREYIGTPEYNATLETIPELRDAIYAAENNYQHHNKLPGLYKIAYLSGQGAKLPDILKSQAASAAQNPPASVRPTMAPPTAAPPTQPSHEARPSFKDINGIKAVIADAEARGAKLDF